MVIFILFTIISKTDGHRERLKQKTGNKLGGFKVEEYWLNKEECPFGTVPIRRMTKKQLQSATRYMPLPA